VRREIFGSRDFSEESFGRYGERFEEMGNRYSRTVDILFLL
jgi:hypothetical protein